MDECTAAIIGVVSLTDVNSWLSPGLSSRQTSISKGHHAGSIRLPYEELRKMLDTIQTTHDRKHSED